MTACLVLATEPPSPIYPAPPLAVQACMTHVCLHTPSPSACPMPACVPQPGTSIPTCALCACLRAPFLPTCPSLPKHRILALSLCSPSLPAPPVATRAFRPLRRAPLPRPPIAARAPCAPAALGPRPCPEDPRGRGRAVVGGSPPPSPPSGSGAAPRAPPCPAGPGGAAHPAPLAEARKGGPRQAERRGSRMAAGQRRDTASSPLALALGLLAVAQVRGFAGPPPASPGRGSPAAQGRREVRTCGSRGRPGRAALPRWAPPRPAGTCRGCPQPLPARRAAGGLCRLLGVPSARSREPGSSRQIPRREDGRVLVKVAMLLSFSECRE